MNEVRRVTFIADGSAGELQRAAAKAGEALQALAKEAARQARASVAAGQSTIKSNEAVAKSISETATAAKTAADGAAGAAAKQEAAAAKTAGAAKKSATAAKTSAVEQEAAAASTQKATEKTAAVAERSATVQRKASMSAATTAKAGAAEQEAAATKSAAAFGRSSSALTHFGRNSALALTVAAVATADLGVKLEASMMKLHTQAGVTTANMQALQRGILAMAPAVATTPLKLSEGMYHVASSMDAVLPKTTKVREELNILKEAAKGAAIGGSDLQQTSYVLSSAMNSLGLRGHDAGKVMAELNSIVGTGDMRMQDLVGAMSTGFIPAAENFGISLQSAGAGLAYLVDRGTPATLAATRLRMSFALMGAPTKQAAKMLGALGMTSQDVKARTEAMTKALDKAGLRTTTLASDLRKPDGIQVALRDLNDHLHASGLNANASAALISRAFGGGRSGTAIMEMAQHTDVLAKKFDQIGRGVRNFPKDWEATQHTIKYQADQLGATFVDIGTKLGLALIPKLRAAINALRDVYHWFKQNQAAARALGLVFGTVLTVAITAWFASLASKLASATRDVVALGRGLASVPGRLERTITGSAAGSAAAGSGASDVLGRTGMLGGLRSGYGLPGSAVNPLVVTVEGGGIGGVAGSTAAAGERSAGGTILPAGAKEKIATQTEAEIGGLRTSFVGSLRTGLGSIVGSVTKGAGIAGMGVLGAQLAGTAIGGSAGHTVSSVGSTAAVGAGLGSFFGPEGTAAGAIVGGLVGMLHSIGKDYTAKIAEQATKGLGGNAHDSLQKRIADDMRNAQQHADASTNVHTRGSRGRGAGSPTTPTVTPNPEERAKTIAAQTKLGADMAQALGQGFRRFKFGDLNVMLDEFSHRMNKMPLLSKEVAAKSMVDFAHELETQGRLPKGATAELIRQLEVYYPPLKAYLAQQGRDSVKALALSLRSDEVQRAAADQVKKAGDTFEGLGPLLKAAGGDTRTQWATTMEFLREETKHGTSEARKAAQTELDGMVALSKKNASQFALWMAIGTSNAAISAATNLSGLTKVFSIALGDIAGQTQDISKSFGVKAVNYVARNPKKVIATGLQVAIGAIGALTKAEGGYIGAPGDRAHDAVHTVLGRGEAVLNHHQQGPVQTALAISKALGVQQYGSLGELFGGVTRKHYMASGGFAGGQVFTASTFGGHNDPSAFNRPTASGKIANDSLWGFAELSNPPGSLNFSALGHLPLGKMLGFTYGGKTVQAPKVDVGAGGAGLNGHVRGVDLTYAVGQALGVNGLANIIVSGLKGALGSAMGQIVAPKITGPGGALQDLANGALGKATAAANSYVAKLQPSPSAGGGSFPSNPSAFYNPSQLQTFDGLPVPKWTVPELSWARGRGWGGRVTSGWRSPSDVVHGAFATAPQGKSEHRFDIWPHGAVDVSDYQQFAQIIRGYPGVEKLIQLPIDPLHFSGTGHAAGGFVGASAGRSGARVSVPSGVKTAMRRITAHIATRHTKHKPSKTKPRDRLASALAPFPIGVDDALAPLNVTVGEIKGRIDALGNQYQGLATISGDANNYFVGDQDMPYLKPTLQSGENIFAGMTANSAKRLYDQAVAKAGSNPSPQLDLQGQMLDWILGQPDHQLLTGTDVSILGSTFGPAGLSFHPGQQLPDAQIANLGMQIKDMGSQVTVEKAAVRTVARAIKEREQRRTLVNKLAGAAKTRLDHINADLRKLNSKRLADRLHAAQDGATQSQRVYDAETQRTHYSDLIAHERASAKPDRSLIKGWEERRAELTSFIHGLHHPSSKVTQAQVAILRNQLMDTRRPVEGDLHSLAGNSTSIGSGGMLAKIRQDIGTLSTGSDQMKTDIAGRLQSDIPGARLERLGILESLPESERPTLAPDAAAGDNSQLTALLQQQNQQLAQAFAVSQAQFAVFKNFLPMLPKYEHGGMVRNTGLALVHEGEWITPNPRGPYGSQVAAPASAHTTVHLHLADKSGELVKLIDARVESRAPHAVSIVQGQRARAIGSAPGGKQRRSY